MGQFNYWIYYVSHAAWGEYPPGEQSVDRESHCHTASIYRQLCHGSQENKLARLKALRPHFGNLVDNPKVYPLCWYIYSDKLWQQDQEAWDALKKLPETDRARLVAFDRRKWKHRGKWSWKDLLATIAKDQLVFREILILGPAESGLVERSWKRSERADPVWRRHGISKSRAKRIYDHYNPQLSNLLGLGIKPPPGWREWMQEAGYLGPDGRVPTEPIMEILPRKSKKERKKFSDVVIHWFAHALRNLREYRNGRPPILWDPFACMMRCLTVQRQLCR